MKRTMMMMTMAMAAVAATAQVVINVDANQRGPKISDTHYGIFFEDINHAADGGLYAELIRNRSFEDGPRFGEPATTEAWHRDVKIPSKIEMKLIQNTKKTPLLNKVQHNALELTIDATASAPVSLINDGFWGINAVQGRTYKLSFWAKGQYKGTIKAALTDSRGELTYATTEVNIEGMEKKEWKKFTAVMTADDNDPRSQFALIFDGKGTLDIDVVSLFPPTFKNRENGMRPDLASMLAEMKPKFMRFPGGCFVEGQDSPDNAFRWERTIGPIEEREGHWNVNWGYRTTDGIGFHEYLQLAEDLGAKPLYVVNVGLWHGGLTPVEEIQPWIDECLAALEYANGDVTTKYGAMRAKNGHPAPFNIEYLEIGNENNQPDQRQQSDHYYERYDKFRQAIRAKYPNIKLIGNVVAWGDDNPKWGSDVEVDLLDEHYYRNPAWFADAFRKYDKYPRTLSNGKKAPAIYVGEYAVTSNFGNLGNQNAALGEAVYMMGIENNSDIVPLNSYAPIFVNENDAKWRPDMIRFNSHQVMGTPSYYVQQLMATNVGKQVVRVKQQNPYKRGKYRQITPKTSRAGFGTWATSASFEGSANMESISGEWTTSGAITSQAGNKEQCIAVSRDIIDTDHYTLRYKARKDGGAEGFLIVFNYVDENNYCWVNFGGWGNTQHAIEQVNGGGKLQVVTKQGKVETGRWYDVTVTVAGDSVKAWLDKELVFDTKLKHDTSKGIFSSATIDDTTGEMIVKVVNNSENASTADICLSNFHPQSARVIRLQANDGMDENTLKNPLNISPREQVLSPEGDQVQLTLPAYSLNIVRIKK